MRRSLETLLPFAAALVALDAQHRELAHDVAKDDGAFAGHLGTKNSGKDGYRLVGFPTGGRPSFLRRAFYAAVRRLRTTTRCNNSMTFLASRSIIIR